MERGRVREKALVLALTAIIFLALAGYYVRCDVSGSSYESSSLVEKSQEISLNKESYILGEDVTIYFADPEKIKEASIISSRNSYVFVGEIKNSLDFKPPEQGNYTVQAILTDGKKENAAFSVITEFSSNQKEQKVEYITTDKKIYEKNERVSINLSVEKNQSYDFSISSRENIYNFVSVSDKTIYFIPQEEGRHYLRLTKNDVLMDSSFFDVNPTQEKNIQQMVWTDKKEYFVGETAKIFVEGNPDSLRVISGKEIFYFENITKNLLFNLKEEGNYKIVCYFENETSDAEFYVFCNETEKKQQYAFQEEIIFEFNFSSEIEKRKTILDRIFKTSVIEQITAYVEKSNNLDDFNIDIERIDENSFKVYVKGNENAQPGKYILAIETSIKGEKIIKNKEFIWKIREKQDYKTEIENEEEDESKTEIEKIILFFKISENPLIEVDFTGKVKKENSIIDAALKKPTVEKISAYVYGEHENPDFEISITHVEFDKFRLSIKSNDNINPDVYRIVAVVKKQNEFFSEQMLFSWGISNISLLQQMLQQEQNRVISIDEVITTTQINQTKEKNTLIDKQDEKETQDEEQEKDELYEDEEKTDLKINKSDKLINLSNKLISEKLSIKNLDEEVIDSEIKVLDERNKSITEVRERKIFGVFSAKTISEVDAKEYDLEITLKNHSIKKVLMSDLVLKDGENPELKIENLKKEDIDDSLKNPKNSFSIDPSELNFTNAELTLNARGSELYKCKDWNFTEQKCYGQWEKVKDIVPGEDYTIDINSEDPAFTEIGLVTINTHKSVYLPNEEAFIGIGILDHRGRVVCNASVVLEITEPNGKKTTLTTENNEIKISDECHLYEVTELPDYYTTYKVGNPGEYTMKITALTYDGNPVMVDSFYVESHVDFDVERNGPTRIFPPVKYEMNFTIKANNDYNGPITEIVPKGFEITSQDGLTVSETEENKILAWDKNLEKGNVYSIGYEFDAPDVWPDIFYLGPLSIGIWYESREWQIASDAQKCVIQDVGTFDISAPDINIGSTTTATADISTQNPNGAVDAGTWEIFIETDGDTRITTSCQGGVPVKVISATGSGGDYSTYCVDNTPNNATITCSNVPKGTNLGTFTFTIEGCEAGSDTYRLESTTTTNSLDSFTGSDTLTVNAADSTPPTVSLSSPYDDTWQKSRNVNFTYTTTTNDHYENCSLWTNESGWRSKQANKSSIINNSINWINETFDSDGHFLWNIECYDQNGNSDMDSENYTVKVDTSNPTVTLESPDPDYYDDTSDPATVTFNCSITDNLQPKNISLYLTNGNNESFSFNDSCTVSVNDYCEWSKSLPNGNYTWNCLGYDEAGWYDWGNNQTVKINSTFSVPQIDKIQCQEQNEGWVDCSNIDFHETLLAVRVNFTDAYAYITNVSFNLTNIPDSYTYFYSNSSYNSSGYWVYNNTDIIINDSGGFKLEVNSWNSLNTTDSSSAEWNIPWGTLTANLINPTTDTPVNKDFFFVFTAEVSCIGGECGNINAILDPMATAYYDPSSDVQTGWSCTGGSCATGHYAVLDEGTRQPNSPVTTDYVYEACNAESIDEHSIDSISEDNLQYITIWAYISTGSNCALGIKLKNGSTIMNQSLWGAGTSFSWV
ncbi:MAG: hypothetical protein PHV16_02215, partial [Candidatus Nanoarchaeia archaeon]|nr:hypothetical protein [Candidatus Nanoarchaeia archaeon]